jgi:stage V sporulation protein G
VEITEVRIKLMEDPDDRLRAFCSVTFDNCFVVRDLKIIEGATGPFVAMPSRKLTSHCGKCGSKNHLRANYCNQCGGRLREQAARDPEGRVKLYADIAHPINSQCREQIQNRVIDEFRIELERSGQPGYVSRYDEEYDEGDYEPGDYEPAPPPAEAPPAAAPSPDRTLRADAPQGPLGPHVGEQPPSEKSLAEERPSGPREELPKSTFGEGIFEEGS